jgi:hypothetical protein
MRDKREKPVAAESFVYVGSSWTGELCQADQVAPGAWISTYNEPSVVLDVPTLAPQGEVFILNMPKRAVPAVVPATGAFTWAHDGIDLAELLRGRFTLRAEGVPDKTRTPNMADAGAFWMSLVR